MTVPATELMRVLAEIVDADPGERRDRLEALSAGDPELHREIESLLAYENASLAVRVPTLSSAALAGNLRSTGAGGEVRAGVVVGPYRLQQLLGRGGMGEVWLAIQDAPIRREVALKLVKLGMDTEPVVRRFELERQTLAELQHPNIARVFDAGATETGRPFLVMEHVVGAPITVYADRERLSIRQRVELFLELCDAIEYAHRKGVIHRDLKPANVLVSDLEGRPCPKVIDFGLAKLVSPDAGASRLTLGALPLGTPVYMSPEQAGGGEIDTRADVYALGVILYELLTGCTPWEARATDGSPLGQFRHLLDDAPVTRPSKRAAIADRLEARASARRLEPARLAKTLEREYDWIATRATAKERAQRYGSVTELAADLRRKLDGRPIASGPQTFIYSARVFVRRRRREVILGAAGIVCMLVLAAIGIRQSLATNNERELRRQTVIETIAAFDQAIDQIADQPGALSSRLLLADALAGRLEEMDTSDDLDTRRLVARTLKRYAELLAGLGQANIGEEPRAQAYMKRAIGILDTVYAELPTDEVGFELAMTHVAFGGLGVPEAIALRRSERALALMRRHPPTGRDEIELADLLDGIGFLMFQEARPSGWDENRREAAAIRDRLIHAHPDDPRIKLSLAGQLFWDAYASSLDPEAALRTASRAVAIIESIELTPQNRWETQELLAGAKLGLAHARLDIGDHEGAVRIGREGCDLLQSMVVDSTEIRTRARLALAVHRYAEILEHTGRGEEGLSEHERGYALWKEIRRRAYVPGWTMWEMGFSAIYLARARLAGGDVEGAVAAYRDYLALRRYEAGSRHGVDMWLYGLEAIEAFRRAGHEAQRAIAFGDLQRQLGNLDDYLERAPGERVAYRTLAAMYALTADLARTEPRAEAWGAGYDRALALARERLGPTDELTRIIEANRTCWTEHLNHGARRAEVVEALWGWVAARRGQRLDRRPPWETVPMPERFDAAGAQRPR